MLSQHKNRTKGNIDYDYANDVIFFKVHNREYLHSIELINIVIDFDDAYFITGLQIFDASKFFNLPKEFIRSIKGMKFEAKIEEHTIEIRLVFSIIYRNKIIEKNPILIQPIGGEFPDSQLVCTC